MKTSKIKRNFRFSYAELIRKVNVCIGLLNRDIAELAKYNIAIILTDLNALLQTFTDIPSDEAVMGKLMTLKLDRDNSKMEIKTILDSVVVRFKNIYKNSPQKIHELGANHLSLKSYNDIYCTGLQTLKACRENSTDLETRGFTQADADDFEIKLTNLNEAITKYNIAVTARQSLTSDRLAAGNALYEKLVEACDYGKDYWENRNYIHYHEYTLYDDTPTPAKVIGLVTNQSVLKPVTLNFIGIKDKSITIDRGDGTGIEIKFTGELQTDTHNYTKTWEYNINITGDVDSIVKFGVPGSGIKSITLPNSGNEELIDISLQDNELSLASMNAFLRIINSYNTYSGIIHLTGGTNAIPSGDCIQLIQELKMRMWSVETN